MQTEGGRILEPRALLEANLALIKGVIRYFAYQYRIHDADDFEGDVMLSLVEKDYAVLRAFKGESTFRTYISVVVQHMAFDSLARLKGRWRPSVEVQRLGELAIELDKLLNRDRHTLEEAVRRLLAKYEGVTRESVEALAAKLPLPSQRPYPVRIDDVDAKDLHRPPNVDDRVLADELRRIAAKVSQVGSAFIAGLEAEDRVILKLRYRDGVTVAQIARMLWLDQKSTYPRIDKLNLELRRELERAGITASDIRDLIGKDEIFVHFDFGNED